MAISINSDTGNIYAGGNGTDGDLVLQANNGENRIRLDAGGGNMWLGGNGADGDIVIFSANGNNSSVDNSTINISGDGGNIFAGGNGVDGDLVLRAENGSDRIRLDAAGGNIWLGGNGADGDLLIFASGGDNSTTGEATIHLNGDAGDIILRNADCAEDFEVVEDEDIEPGTVMVIGENSRLCKSSKAYDRCVAGVVAGAGLHKPGIVLGRKEGAKNALPIALVGRVLCKVDASYGAVSIGDLLTTSPSPGFAMNAKEPQKAFGAVIGKALGSLKSGKDLVPTLIALQ
jgi:hypothetical protein